MFFLLPFPTTIDDLPFARPQKGLISDLRLVAFSPPWNVARSQLFLDAKPFSLPLLFFSLFLSSCASLSLLSVDALFTLRTLKERRRHETGLNLDEDEEDFFCCFSLSSFSIPAFESIYGWLSKDESLVFLFMRG